ncbi:MAG: hypothetical protein HMLKMBBP_03885 [Planctomycetes bacterium]|nr:hypothetical protein [Planctomycetota bacterium]
MTTRRDLRPAALLLLVAAASALADVDLQVGNADKIAGTIDPGSEVETIRFPVPAGAAVTFKAKPAKGGPALAADVYVGGDLAATAAPKGKGIVAAATAAVSEEARVLLTSADGTATGGYSASVKWKSQRKFGGAVTLPGGGSNPSIPFGADGGAVVTATAKAARGSLATPRLLRILGPDGFDADVGSTDGATGSDRAGPVTLPVTGTYRLDYDDPSGQGGDATITISVKPPKPSKRKIDVTAARTGASGDDGAIARIVGTEGGDVAVPAGLVDGMEALEGAGVSFPPGALSTPTAIVIATAPLLDPDGAQDPVGPAVYFGPEGAEFGIAATVTIPFDPADVGGDTALVRIYTRDARGRVTEVPPPYTFNGGFVSFPATHFSSFAATADTGALPTIATLLEANGIVDICDGTLAGDVTSRMFYVDGGNTVLQAVSGTNPMWTPVVWAGGGTLTTDGTDRLQFMFPTGLSAVAQRSGSRVYVASGNQVWTINASSGQVSRIIGDGTSGDGGDNAAGTAARLGKVEDLHVDGAGNLLIVDSLFDRVRRWDPVSGNIFAFAGTGTEGDSLGGLAPLSTDLRNPTSISMLFNGDYFLAERNRVRFFSVSAGVMTIAAGPDDNSTGCTTTFVSASSARFTSLNSVMASGTEGALFTDAACHAIYLVILTPNPGFVSVFRGAPGLPGYTPDGPFLPGSNISAPASLLFDPSGAEDHYFLDQGSLTDRAIRQVRDN